MALRVLGKLSAVEPATPHTLLSLGQHSIVMAVPCECETLLLVHLSPLSL